MLGKRTCRCKAARQIEIVSFVAENISIRGKSNQCLEIGPADVAIYQCDTCKSIWAKDDDADDGQSDE